jgi:GTP-binding protein EngB required for normal cell division
MSKSSKTEDVWTKLEKTSDEREKNAEADGSLNSSVVFVGDLSSGKSTLIQNFLNPKNTKDAKATVALDFNFARKTVNNVKSVGNIWEVGGDLSVTPKLLEIGVSTKSFLSSTVVITCDLSKPFNVLSSLIRNITVIRELVSRRSAELQATNVHQLGAARDRQLAVYQESNHQDANRIKLCEVPLIIAATKFDSLKSQQSADRKAIIQVLRFVAHYYSASLFVCSNNDSSLKDAFRSVLTCCAFSAPIKPSFETNLDKPPFVHITRGQDSFDNILLQTPSATDCKSRLISDPRDIDLYVTNKGVTKDCWKRIQEHLTIIFGEPDPAPTSTAEAKATDELETGADRDGLTTEQRQMLLNPFPETDIDSIRVLRDAELARHIQEARRREEMQTKITAMGE